MFENRPATVVFPRLRLAFAIFLALFSLLAVFKAPARLFWIPAIVATEAGYFLAIPCLLLTLASHRGRFGRRIVLLSCAAAGFFLSPLVRAWRIAPKLPSDLTAAFGPTSPRESPGALARKTPISAIALFRGMATPPVRLSTRFFSPPGSPVLSMDLYQPMQQGRPLPAVLVIHGGGWSSGDKEDFSALSRYLAARGYLTVSVNYRLAPRWPFPAAHEDVFRAIRFMKQHAREIGWDGRQVVLLGRSAGGQIALSVAYAQREPTIRGVAVFYAPNDLVFGYSRPANPLVINSRKVIETYLGGPPDRHPGLYEAASPLNFVNRWTPPTLMIHGGRDELVWAVHEERLSRRLTEARRPHFYLRLPWATHGCDAHLSGPSGQLSTYALERFLSAVMPTVR